MELELWREGGGGERKKCSEHTYTYNVRVQARTQARTQAHTHTSGGMMMLI